MSALPHDEHSLGDFERTPELDRLLDDLAHRARANPSIRNHLFQALGFKVQRFVRRYRFQTDRLNVFEPEDVEQEAFLVFCELIDAWPGEQHFSGYFFSRFPWRLARAVDVAERGWSGSRLVPFAEVQDSLPPLTDDDCFTLAEAGANLDERDRTILMLHIGYGLRLGEIGELIGVHRRTVYRSWKRIRIELQAGWADMM